MEKTVKNSVNGFHYLVRGFELLRHPKLRHYVIIPILINLLLFVVTLVLLIHWFGDFTVWLNSLLPNWMHWLKWLLWPVFIILSVITVFYFSTFIGNIITAPFNSLLSDKVIELYQGKKTPAEFGIVMLFKQIPASIYRESLKLFYYLPRAIVCLILFLIPVIQIAAAVIWFLFSAWAMTMQYLDYPAENAGISFRILREKMQQRRLGSLAFGSTVTLATMIPVINFVIIPAATIGATLLWIEQYDDAQPRLK